MDYVDWNRGLLLGGLLIVIAAMALVAGHTKRDRLMAAGVLAQGIAMTFVAGAAFYPRAGLEIAALVLIVLWSLWSVWIISDGRRHDGRSQATDKRPSTVDPIMPASAVPVGVDDLPGDAGDVS